MRYALTIDPERGDLVLEDGELELSTDPSPELLLAIGIARGSVHADPDQGSDIPHMVAGARIPTQPETEIPPAARQALARLEATGLISMEAVTYDPAERLLRIDVAELASPIHIPVL